ncbi:MAG: hypothetical protein ACK58T_15140, partial [Phycisphaerae bacterium]
QHRLRESKVPYRTKSDKPLACRYTGRGSDQREPAFEEGIPTGRSSERGVERADRDDREERGLGSR